MLFNPDRLRSPLMEIRSFEPVGADRLNMLFAPPASVNDPVEPLLVIVNVPGEFVPAKVLPGRMLPPEATLTLPFTLPMPLKIWPEGRYSVEPPANPDVSAVTSKVAVEFTRKMFGLLPIDP